MSDFALSPYYHPTTIVLVDDSQIFLDSLDLDLSQNCAFVTFTQPEAALEFLNKPPTLAPLVDRCFSLDYQQGSDPIIHLDMNVLEQEVTHIERFQRNAVLIVDYAMPLMNGLELCTKLNDPYLMKAMLTGVADEKIAVQAFNAGLIHRFVPKQSLNAVDDISRFVDELQSAYFNQYTARLRSNLAIDPPAFLMDPAVAEFVQQLMRREQLVEYYLVSDPDGLLLLDGTGTMLRLLVLDESDMDAQVQYVSKHGAPSSVVQQLRKRRRLCYFWDQPENYFGDEAYPWHEHTLTVTSVKGERLWYLAVAEDPPVDIDFNPAESSFDAFISTVGKRAQ